MPTQATRRRFIEIMPLAGFALLAACSPKNEPPPPCANEYTPCSASYRAGASIDAGTGHDRQPADA